MLPPRTIPFALVALLALLAPADAIGAEGVKKAVKKALEKSKKVSKKLPIVGTVADYVLSAFDLTGGPAKGLKVRLPKDRPTFKGLYLQFGYTVTCVEAEGTSWRYVPLTTQEIGYTWIKMRVSADALVRLELDLSRVKIIADPKDKNAARVTLPRLTVDSVRLKNSTATTQRGRLVSDYTDEDRKTDLRDRLEDEIRDSIRRQFKKELSNLDYEIIAQVKKLVGAKVGKKKVTYAFEK